MIKFPCTLALLFLNFLYMLHDYQISFIKHMSPSPDLPRIGTHELLGPGIQSWFRYFVAKLILAFYLGTHPQVRSRIIFEIDCPPGDDYGVWEQYDYWPQAWKNRLAAFLAAYRAGAPLSMEEPLPLGPDDPFFSWLAESSSGSSPGGPLRDQGKSPVSRSMPAETVEAQPCLFP